MQGKRVPAGVFLLLLLPLAAAASSCGDGRRTGSEGCDDGNAVSGDGCSWECQVEHGYSCNKKNPTQCNVECPNYPIPDRIRNKECSECNVDLRPVPAGLMADDPVLLEALREADAAIEATRVDAGIASLAYAVVHDQELVWFRGHGYTDASRPDASVPDIDTIYRLGSITKVFTALAMLLMHQDGVLPSIDGLVSDVVPELNIHDAWATPRGGLTWRHLASQMAGLTRECPCGPLVFTANATIWCDGLSFEDIIPRLNEEYTQRPKGTHPQYSNCAFTVLGRGLERVSGIPYEQYTTERIFNPLGMSATHFWPTAEDEPHVARGYEVLLEDLALENAEGQLFSSTRDMVEFLKFLMRWYEPANSAEGQILDGATIREWLRPDYMDYDGTGGWGMPWEIYHYYGHMLVGKAGGMSGYTAYVDLIPDLKIGIIAMENSDYYNYEIMRRPLYKLLIPAVRAFEETVQTKPALPPSTLEYEGMWQYDQSGYLIDMNIHREGDFLLADSDAWYSLQYALEYISEDTFRTVEYATFGAPYASCRSFEFASDTGEVFQFKRDATGQIEGFYMQGATYYGELFTRVESPVETRSRSVQPDTPAQRTLRAIRAGHSKRDTRAV